jgi:ribosome-binding factor A
MTRRTDRLGHLIQRELGDFIFREMSDQRVGFVTISRVEVTTDLSHAKVLVSVLGDDKEKRNSMEALAHAFRINAVLKDIQAREKQGGPAVPDGGDEET